MISRFPSFVLRYFLRAAVQDVRGRDNLLRSTRDFTEDLIISTAVEKRSIVTRGERRVDSGDCHYGNGRVTPAFGREFLKPTRRDIFKSLTDRNSRLEFLVLNKNVVNRSSPCVGQSKADIHASLFSNDNGVTAIGLADAHSGGARSTEGCVTWK
jgi:hypothetical protein